MRMILTPFLYKSKTYKLSVRVVRVVRVVRPFYYFLKFFKKSEAGVGMVK